MSERDTFRKWCEERGYANTVWFLDEQTNELCYRAYESSDYRVDLDRATTPEEVLDWIAQVSHKTWCSSRCLADLVRALDEMTSIQESLLLGKGPQRNIFPRFHVPTLETPS